MSLAGFYLNPHRCQFDGSAYQGENCGPTSAANGANASTGGKVNKTGAQVRSLIARSAETNPATPGWSLEDIDHAMAKLSVGFAVHSGEGWGSALTFLQQGHYLNVQGDSDQFSDGTCSGRFNGGHCIGVHPAHRVLDGVSQHWIDDPICKTGRWEYDPTIRAYAVKLNSRVQFGVFTAGVPKAVAALPWHISFLGGAFWIYKTDGKPFYDSRGVRYGGTILSRKRMSFSVPTGAPCTKPLPYIWPTFGTKYLTEITAGKLDGEKVGTASPSVHVEAP
jgi:hypothetical protein